MNMNKTVELMDGLTVRYSSTMQYSGIEESYCALEIENGATLLLADSVLGPCDPLEAFELVEGKKEAILELGLRCAEDVGMTGEDFLALLKAMLS
jgi:hypothetical protein